MSTKDKTFKRFTVTSALPYANGPLHIGHVAGAYLPADIYVRYLRACKKDVVYICGTDEYGAAISIKAQKEGTTPQAIVDKYHTIIRDAFKSLNVSFDIFSRTTNPTHHETATEFFTKFHREGKFVEKDSVQLYDEQANRFLADRYVTGTCPKCGNPHAYGDQCERCGSSLNATDLIHPKSTITGSTPVLRETRHWYLPLDQYQQQLEKYVLEDHPYWKSNVFGQCKSWLNDQLQARAITRDQDWGIPVPVEGGEGKVLYVWFDAPIGYISATKEWAARENRDWKEWWQDKETALIHFIGKDNIVFHCLIFPAILLGHGEYILPENVPANEFLNLEDNKISTSRNYAVWVDEFFRDFPDKCDELRYVLGATLPETKDNNFSWDDFQSRVNSELVAVFGNFVNRVVTLTVKNFDGKVAPRAPLEKIDEDVLAEVLQHVKSLAESIEDFRFREALNTMMNIARAGNKYLADTEPWKLMKTDVARAGSVLNIGAHICAVLSVAAKPFLPVTADKLTAMFHLGELSWSDLENSSLVTEGMEVTHLGLLFQQIEDDAMASQKQKLQDSLAASSATTKNIAPMKEATSFDDFSKMDIRSCTILSAEKVSGADKLLQLSVDTGLDKRTIVSGVAEHFAPEDLVGKQAICLANLAPRKIRGVMSEGMLLFAETPEGKLRLVSPESGTENGSVVK